MKKHFERKGVAIITAMLMVVATTVLGGCAGRKMDNMEPNGETIEVMAQPAPAATDSIV